MGESKTILFAGGGTGGHLFPGIAVAEALRTLMPEARPLFLCTQKEIDRIILAPTGFDFIPQPIVPRTPGIGGLLKFSRSLWETYDLARKVIREHAPVAALGLGGYAAGVVIRKAAAKKIPSALINPDVVPGKANQFLIKRVKAVCCQFEATAGFIAASRRNKVKITGCPIRDDIRHPPLRAEAAGLLDLNPNLLTLLVTGASQGAQTVNEAVLTLLADLPLSGWQVLHLAGRDHADAVRAGYRELAERGKPIAVQVIDFTPAMSDIWAVTDLAISRSGASSCAELTACGIPSILLPYPFHKDMHQRLNAKILCDAGAAVLVDDEKDRRKNADKLRPVLQSLLNDAGKRQAMAQAARNLGRPDAAENVARVVMEIASGR